MAANKKKSRQKRKENETKREDTKDESINYIDTQEKGSQSQSRFSLLVIPVVALAFLAISIFLFSVESSFSFDDSNASQLEKQDQSEKKCGLYDASSDDKSRASSQLLHDFLPRIPLLHPFPSFTFHIVKNSKCRIRHSNNCC
mmetsp:Transcript_22362/g.36998  ORF Transcript_22362/g.36998 Transcript_22362/m.36998 type:complete len:143 (+) Transcript_22362:121-549(+)